MDAIAAELRRGDAGYALLATLTEDDLRDIAFAKLYDRWDPAGRRPSSAATSRRWRPTRRSDEATTWWCRG